LVLVNTGDQDINVQQSLDANFLDIWTLYLEQGVARHKRMVELAGSPTRALIAQAIYWHELLLLREVGTQTPYNIVREQINSDKSIFDNFIKNKKLTATLLSEITAIPFETTRRQLKLMADEGMVEKSDNFGFLINKDSEFHHACVQLLNPFEKTNLVKLCQKIIDTAPKS